MLIYPTNHPWGEYLVPLFNRLEARAPHHPIILSAFISRTRGSESFTSILGTVRLQSFITSKLPIVMLCRKITHDIDITRPVGSYG